MPNSYFQFKQFIVHQGECGMKITTDACLFGAWIAENIKSDETIKHVLDIGSGTGLLSLMIAQQSAATIDAIEVQQKEFNQSKQNIENSPWQNRIHIFNADVANFVFNKKYDAIISNPPFYESDLKGIHLQKNIAHHDAGLNLKTLLQIIRVRLNKNGKFYILFPEKRRNDLLQIVKENGLFVNKLVDVHQTEKHRSFRVMIEGSFLQAEIKKQSITIQSLNDYTIRFKALLKDYYLKF